MAAGPGFPSIGDSPHQPRKLSFPKREFGKQCIVKHCFQASWFGTWKWLHYDEQSDSAFCHIIMCEGLTRKEAFF